MYYIIQEAMIVGFFWIKMFWAIGSPNAINLSYSLLAQYFLYI